VSCAKFCARRTAQVISDDTCRRAAPTAAGSRAKSIYGRQADIFAFRRDWAQSDQGGESRDFRRTDDEGGPLGQQSATAPAAESASTNAPRVGTARATHFEGAFVTLLPFFVSLAGPATGPIGTLPFPRAPRRRSPRSGTSGGGF